MMPVQTRFKGGQIISQKLSDEFHHSVSLFSLSHDIGTLSNGGNGIADSSCAFHHS